jgi:hypothetical protein
MSDAIAKALSTRIHRTQSRVAFARGRKLLLKITNRMYRGHEFFRRLLQPSLPGRFKLGYRSRTQ